MIVRGIVFWVCIWGANPRGFTRASEGVCNVVDIKLFHSELIEVLKRKA